MKAKRLISILLALVMVLCTVPVTVFAADGDVVIDEKDFPDDNFRAYVKENFDKDNDDILSEAEIAAATEIDVSFRNIASLKGVEYFTALERLDCYWNQLTSLDVSKNTALTWLYCDGNQLTSLDVSNNTSLTWLYCDGNQLTSLDVSNNTSLEELYCSYNQLTSLDVSNNTSLEELYCSYNQLTSLDVSKNTAIKLLNCYNSEYTITLGDGRTFDLETLPGSFDVNKASAWNGGTVSENILTVDEDATEVTYNYDVGWWYGGSLFKLVVISDTPVQPHEHSYVEIERLDPTCTKDGYVKYECEHCLDSYTETLTSPGHTPAEAVRENVVGATCTETGSYDEVVYCSVCEEELSRETKTVEALGHTEETLPYKAPTCTETGLTEGKKCSECGEILVEQVVIPALGHIRRVVNESVVYTGDIVCKRCGEILEKGIHRPFFSYPLIPSQPTVPTEPPVPVEPTTEELPFTDVAKDAPYYEAVKYLYEAGIMNGTGDTTFSPDFTLNRATVVTMLYKLEGETEVSVDATFTDVEADEWYTAAVQWAASVGIVEGYGDGTFGPKKNVTNEQLAAIIKRYAEYKGVTINETTELPADAVVSDWAVANVAWAASEEILSAEQIADAKSYADRAQVAVSVYTYIMKVGE